MGKDKIAEEGMWDLLKPTILGKKGKPGIIIGSVHGINDEGALLTEFKPTKAELEILAEEYLHNIQSIHSMFELGQSGSYEIRMLPFANRRLDRIEKYIGKDKVDEIAKRVFYCENCKHRWISICKDCKWENFRSKPTKFKSKYPKH